MSLSADRLERAERQADAARARLLGTVSEIRTRLNPARVAREAAREARDVGEKLVENGQRAVSRNRGAAIGAAGAAVVLFIGRTILKRRKASESARTTKKSRKSA